MCKEQWIIWSPYSDYFSSSSIQRCYCCFYYKLSEWIERERGGDRGKVRNANNMKKMNKYCCKRLKQKKNCIHENTFCAKSKGGLIGLRFCCFGSLLLLCIVRYIAYVCIIWGLFLISTLYLIVGKVKNC